MVISMPRKLKIDGIKAELSDIADLINESLLNGDPIGAKQFSYKKALLEEELSLSQNDIESRASVALFFGGQPVFGSIGIHADFAGKALYDFQEIVSKVFSSHEIGLPGARGPISKSGSSQLMITQVAKGSFGFVLDELDAQMTMTETKLKIVVDDVVEMIDKTASNESSKFEDVISEIDNRTLISLRNFFINLDRNSATLRLVEGEKDFQFDELAIQRGRQRTENSSIEEQEEYREGVLIGFLPEHRKFELKLSSGDSIYGTINKDATEAIAQMISTGPGALGQRCRIRVVVRTIQPLNRPQKVLFRMLEFVAWL